LLKIYENKSSPRKLKDKKFFWLPKLPEEQKNCCFNS
jgi:hypothetical protein